MVCSEGQMESVSLLLSNGASVNKADRVFLCISYYCEQLVQIYGCATCVRMDGHHFTWSALKDKWRAYHSCSAMGPVSTRLIGYFFAFHIIVNNLFKFMAMLRV